MSEDLNLNITATAIAHFQHILQQHKATGIKLSVKKGGCSSYSYVIDFVQEITDSDYVKEIDDIRIVINRQHLQFFQELVIDYEYKNLGKILTFKNPQATNYCGCGESFDLPDK